MGDDNAGQTSTTTTTQNNSGGPQVLPELQPYVAQVGARAAGMLNHPAIQLSQYLQGQTTNVPGLSPMGNLAGQQIADRGTYGIPTPTAETAAYNQALYTPNYTGQVVQQSPYTQQAGNYANQIAQTGNPVNLSEYTTQGAAGLQNFMPGGGSGISPMIDLAMEGIQQETLPEVQNQLAKSGLSQSGYAPEAVARMYAKELVPLYAQGLQQSQSASGQLASIGSNQQQLATDAAKRQQDAVNQLMGVGTNQQQLSTDALGRYLQGSTAMQQPLLNIAEAQQGRPEQATNELLSFDQLQREIQQAQSQAQMDAFNRNLQIALSYNNPTANFTAAGSNSGSGVSNTVENMANPSYWGK